MNVVNLVVLCPEGNTFFAVKKRRRGSMDTRMVANLSSRDRYELHLFQHEKDTSYIVSSACV